MAQLAIKGHPSKGSKVIEILSMLGGLNTLNYAGLDKDCFYYIGESGIICRCGLPHNRMVFTLEEFLEKYPYKVGDKVTVTGLPEYPKIINFMEWFDGDIYYSFDNETWFLPSALNPHKEETMEVKRMAFAIAGHKTRGKEVIEILEMLGGNNPDKLIANFDYLGYFIGKETRNIYSFHLQGFDSQNVIIFTLEEFLEKFPYKVGDKVSSKYLKNYKIEKMEWEDANNRVIYKLQGMGWYNTSELQPYKEEAMDKAVFNTNAQCCDIINHLIKKETMKEQKKDYEEWFQTNYLEFENNDDTWADEVEVNLGKDYEIQIRGDKTFIVKKQLQYPKTYAECCRIIVAKQDRHYFYTKKDKEQDYPNEIRILDQLDHLRMLIICRDAYWKIIGDWRPDWESSAIKYTIKYQNNNILKRTNEYINSILSFPTEEMRDAFYENFKSLIESCKELL